MTLFPLIRGSFVLATTKGELYRHLRAVCEEDLPLIHMYIASYGESGSTNAYGLEWYGDSFMVWKVPSGMLSRWLFTTLHCKIVEIGDSLIIDYHIRFNLWSNFLTLFGFFAMFYLPFIAITDSDGIDWFTLCVGLTLYPFEMLHFNDNASENQRFVEQLKERFAKND
jgi:hypothetical protein